MSSEKNNKIHHEKQRSSPILIPAINSPREVETDHISDDEDHTRRTGLSSYNTDTVDSLAYEDRRPSRNSVFEPEFIAMATSPPAGSVVMEGVTHKPSISHVPAGVLLMSLDVEIKQDKEITFCEHIEAIGMLGFGIEDKEETIDSGEQVQQPFSPTRSVKHFFRSISLPVRPPKEENDLQDEVDAGGAPGEDWDEEENHSSSPLTPTPNFHQLEKEYRYKMDHAQRGCFIIFNHKNFDRKLNMDIRNGTNLDANSMYQAAHVLGFEFINIINDATRSQIIEFLENISKADHSNYDCFGCAILTHGGDNDVLYASDAALTVKDFTSPFGADRCETLAGKPKLFFIQACRGYKRDPGKRMRHVSNDMVDGSPKVQLASGDMVDASAAELKIPVEADFLIAHSTAPDYYAWRNKGTGSVYIQDLCKMFEYAGHEKEIMQMLTRVNRMVAYDFESAVNNESWNKMKQIPSVCTRLTAELYFNPKRTFQTPTPQQNISETTVYQEESVHRKSESSSSITMMDQTNPRPITPSTSYHTSYPTSKTPTTNFLTKYPEYSRPRKNSLPLPTLSRSYETPPALPPKIHVSASQPDQVALMRQKSKPSGSRQRNSMPPDISREVLNPNISLEKLKINSKYMETDV